MGFKSITQYNDDRYRGMFMLKNDGDSSDVVFLYKNKQDAMMVDAHYIKSDDYSGYTQCLGAKSCPACQEGIRIQQKLFIPLYVLDSEEILFWDRSTRFFQQLENDVFNKFADPTAFVFKITRQGDAGDINTRYSITAVAKNNQISYEEILNKCGATFPEYYNTICVDWSASDYKDHLNTTSSSSVDIDTMPEYKLSPRGVTATSELPDFVSSNDTPSITPKCDELCDSEVAAADEVKF